MKKKQKKIIYTRWGLSNCYKNHIEINEKLKDKPILKQYILRHEQAHKIGKFDLEHEFQINWKLIPSLFLFMITTPRTWIDFSPIQYKNKQIIYDSNMTLLYFLLIILIYILKFGFF